MNIIEKILARAASLLRDSSFIENHKLRPTAFIRRRKLPFDRIASTLIHLAKNSLQIVCNKLGEYFPMNDPASKQAFSQARLNLSHSCFQALNDEALQCFYKEDTQGLWKGYRVFASDGSTVRLPDSPEIEAHFGKWGQGGKNPSENAPILGRVSECTDVISGFTVSAALLPYSIGEQAMAEGQLKLVVEKMKAIGQEQSLFIYDRGYPSKKMISLHHELKVDFLFRIPTGFNKKIDALASSGEKEAELKLYEDMPSLRVAVYELSSGEKEVLLTSLDQKLFSYEELFHGYGARWTMEEGYKKQKGHFELENWATKSVTGILQEFWSMIYVSNILAISCYELEGASIPGEEKEYRLNRSVLFGSMREDVLKTLAGKISAKKFGKKFKKIAERAKVPIRPGRSFSREGLNKPKRFRRFSRVC